MACDEWFGFLTTLTSLLIRGVNTHEDQMFGDHKFQNHPCGDKVSRSFGFANSASIPTSFLSWSTEKGTFKKILSITLRDCHRVSKMRSLFALAKNSILLNIDMKMILRETLLSLCFSFQATYTFSFKLSAVLHEMLQRSRTNCPVVSISTEYLSFPNFGQFSQSNNLLRYAETELCNYV